MIAAPKPSRGRSVSCLAGRPMLYLAIPLAISRRRLRTRREEARGRYVASVARCGCQVRVGPRRPRRSRSSRCRRRAKAHWGCVEHLAGRGCPGRRGLSNGSPTVISRPLPVAKFAECSSFQPLPTRLRPSVLRPRPGRERTESDDKQPTVMVERIPWSDRLSGRFRA
jgi:hypothetical protein